jgi:hypothetical protein
MNTTMVSISMPKFSQSNTEGGGGGGHSERKCIYIFILQKCTIVPKTDRLLVLIWIFLIQISWKHDKKVVTQEQFLPAAKKRPKEGKRILWEKSMQPVWISCWSGCWSAVSSEISCLLGRLFSLTGRGEVVFSRPLRSRPAAVPRFPNRGS